ncbi:MAG: hypothetical protein LBG44_10060 [Gemmatimonadota bacterium]|nr:hypothetical protein [Gemmatimonadota bacterium]
MGDMIRQMAFAIADAQVQLDDASLRVAEMMSGKAADGTDTTISFAGDPVSMLELGFTPTFYQFIDTIIEVKIAIKITSESTTTTKRKGYTTTLSADSKGFRISTTPVDATYTAKYSYTAEGSSLLRTKLAPVPPPSILEERIRALINETPA